MTQYFPRGEQNTSFKWKDYSPCIFSRLREAFGIDNKDYLLSLAGDKCAAPSMMHFAAARPCSSLLAWRGSSPHAVAAWGAPCLPDESPQ